MKTCIVLLLSGVLLGIVVFLEIKTARRSEPAVIQTASDDATPSVSPGPIDEPVKLPPQRKLPQGSVSPFEIVRYLNGQQNGEYVSLEHYWQRLGLEDWERSGYSKCNTAIFKWQLDREPDDEVMLRLYDWSYGVRYLFFKKTRKYRKQYWRLIGSIDIGGQQNVVPPQRIIRAGKHCWLVLRVMTGRGSGFGLYHDIWYEINKRSVTEVLRYPAQKGSFYFPVLQSSARIKNVRLDSGQIRLTVDFFLRYEWYEEPGQFFTLWRKRQTAFFSRDEKTGRFNLDLRKSTVTERELDLIYGDGGVIPEELIRYDYNSLLRIAEGREGKRKNWLRDFMKSLDQIKTADVNRIRELLSR